jgi:AmmeMemoRadiSam system protein A
MNTRGSERGERLSEVDRAELLEAARRAIGDYLALEERFSPVTDSPGLLRRRAAFVTLRDVGTGALRGCRGELRAWQPLIDSVVEGAIEAATDDPRFDPVRLAELPEIRIEISVLTEPEPIEPGAVELGRHGLILRLGSASGLLLPEVPEAHGLKTVEAFLEALSLKAGLAPDAWLDPEAKLMAFETEHWGEEEDEG